jgi:hypothetical protein
MPDDMLMILSVARLSVTANRLFRAAARLVVVFYTRPVLAVKQRKLRTRDRDRQDWASTLTLYQVDTVL